MSDNEPSQVAQRKQHLAGVFDRAAPTYDSIGPHYFSHFGRRLVELVQIAEGARVLDVATGRGAALFPAAAAVGAHGRVIGIDFAPTMVTETGKELAARSVANAEVHQMDAEHLEFPDAAFDYVLCGFANFFFPQLTGAMAEIGRVLKPNGQIGVTTWGSTFRERMNWLEELVKAYLAPGPQASVAGAQPSGGQQPVFDTPAGLEAILQAAGFTAIRVFAEETEFVYATKDEFWSSLWSHGLRAQLERIEQMKGPDGLQRFKREVFSRADAVQQSDGIHQQFPVLYALAAKAAN